MPCRERDSRLRSRDRSKPIERSRHSVARYIMLQNVARGGMSHFDHKSNATTVYSYSYDSVARFWTCNVATTSFCRSLAIP